MNRPGVFGAKFLAALGTTAVAFVTLTTTAEDSSPLPSGEPEPWTSFRDANVALLKEQGFDDAESARLLPGREAFDTLTNLYRCIAPAWATYQHEPNTSNRDALVSALGSQSYRASQPRTEPRMEKLLLQMAATGDPSIEVRALTLMAGFCGSRYCGRLEDYLIRRQIADVKALNTLAESSFGNASQVLREVPFNLETLPVHLLAWAESRAAVTELLRRANDEPLELDPDRLLGYDDDRVRALVSNWELPARCKTVSECLQREFVVRALGIYNLPRAETLLTQCIDELSSPRPADLDEMEAHLWPMPLGNILLAALETGNPRLRSKAVSTLKHNRRALLILAWAADREGARDTILALAPDLTADEVKTSLMDLPAAATELASPFMADWPTMTWPSLHHRALLRDLPEVLHRFFPTNTDWVDLPGHLRLAIPTVLTDIVPTYGAEGTKALLRLGQFKQYHGPALLGLSRVAGERATQLAHVKQLGRPTDPPRQTNPYDVALWVLGDQSNARRLEQYLRFPPNDTANLAPHLVWMGRDQLVDIAKRRNQIGIEASNRYWLIRGLSRHRDREAWHLIWEIWDETASPYNNTTCARLFNRAAGQHFGLRRAAMRAWIDTLPPPAGR